MRIATLLPAATELVCALGAADQLVGISHECDWPPEVTHLPRLTTTPVDTGLASGAIDATVRALVAEGRPAISVDADALRALRPDLLVTQALCDVCAVGDGEVCRVGELLDPAPRVVSLGGTTLDGVLADVATLGAAIGRVRQADALVASLRARLDALRARPPVESNRVLCIEWLDPLYLAGHWVPDLVAAAGGIDVAGTAGEHSRTWDWVEAQRLDPDVIVVMLCGFAPDRAEREMVLFDEPHAQRLFASRPTWVIDGNAYTSRPGPRLVDGAERLRAALEGHEMDGLHRFHARWG